MYLLANLLLEGLDLPEVSLLQYWMPTKKDFFAQKNHCCKLPAELQEILTDLLLCMQIE
jgi:hypothetical protein